MEPAWLVSPSRTESAAVNTESYSFYKRTFAQYYVNERLTLPQGYKVCEEVVFFLWL